MKKIARRPPEEWPPAALAAFLDFEATLSRLKDPSRYLRLLHRFFSHQQRQGLGFDEFPRALLDGYLATLTANARGRFRSSFSAWLRFLYERKEVSRPLHKELLPGNQVHPPRGRVSKLDIRPPEEWPPAAQELYCEFEARLSQRLQRPRTYLRLLYRFFSRQHQQGLSFREFPRAFLDAYLAPLKAQLRSEYVTALTAWLRFLYARKELLLPLHEEMAGYRVPVLSRRRVLLSYQQVMQVLDLPPTDEPQGLRDRAILEMAYGSGMRRGELAYLDLADVDSTLGLVSIRRAKNSCQRTVPLTHWALHYTSSATCRKPA